ncbi:SatD family protein [Streptococcus moroccensis]|uniref:DNA-binding protein n=1 Tax=Streptococcus moroccensis TaxID=1451356 RepID=A0ABT9YP92_9STRE|nr:SatD family protein [Streptococcus moroccensis]MDQ0221801.1 hypothetical protein [Streptococcus moroccensis]
MMYLALIGDFVNSKELDDRYDIQKRLKETLTVLNKKYKKYLVSLMTVTLGDEFQGLFQLTCPIFKLIDELTVALSPYAIRFGLGIGDIVTAIDPEQSIGADGPAYWRARAAIEIVHTKNDYGNTTIAIDFGDEKDNQIGNALIASSDHIKASWRSSQEEIFKALLERGIYQESFEQNVVAEKLGLHESAFSKRLKSSGLKVYWRCRLALQELIRDREGDR